MSDNIWSVVLVSSLAGWLFSSVMLILKAFPVKDVFVVSAGIRWGSVSVISFFIWIVGLLNA